jgi:arsenite methyltransferase
MSDTTAARYFESSTFRNIAGVTLRPGGYDLTNRALEFCDFALGSTILDIGCGLGATQKRLNEIGLISFGIDISHSQISRNTSEPLIQMLANGETVPIKENSLGGIFIECTLSVVLQPDRVLAEVFRLLEPGAMVVISDVYARNIYGIPPLRSALSQTCINSIWSQMEISDMVQLAGLQTVLWEDHFEAIRNLTGRIIFDQGSMGSFWKDQFPKDKKSSVDPLGFQLLLARAKMSYFLLIAQKPERQRI